MRLVDEHKAAIITLLLAGTLVLGMFSIHLKQKGELITESYYELEPEPELIPEIPEEQRLEEMSDPSSDKAFNEDQEYKDMMRNFKAVSANDFERTTKALEAKKAEPVTEESSKSNFTTKNQSYALNSEDTETFRKLQEKLKKRQKDKNEVDEHANARSSLTYSLKGRVLEFYKTPRYLCEYGGKIVVSIRVDAQGNVFDAFINGASTSDNQCLIESAIDYAKTARFNNSDRKDQLGTITFTFKGKV